MENRFALKKTSDQQFYWFLLFWFIQANFFNYFIDVSGEEAYYWLFGQYPAWGYLDHPPMIGWLTGLGYKTASNALGLRLFMALLSTAMLWLVREIVGKQNDRLLIWLCIGLAPTHAAAYLVKTDVPLIFFLLLFFYGYKRYLKEVNWLSIALLTISIVGVMLSKYHGFIVVIFVVLSNLALLKKKSFWLVVGLVSVLMLPHLYWQIEHDFITFKFHLFSRKDLGFKWNSITYFTLVQPLVFGPITGVILFYAFFKGPVNNQFDRALKFAGYGVIVFFFYLSFKVEFHKHWTSVLSIPLTLYGFGFINQHKKLEKLTITLSKISFGLMILAKIYLSYDFLPKSINGSWDVVHGWQAWADDIEELSEGLPVVFENNYERASKYYFLSGNPTHSYNTASYRETQHDLLNFEQELQGKKVFWINRSDDPSLFTSHITPIGKEVQYRVVENFRSYRKVWIELEDDYEIDNGRLTGILKLENTSDLDQDFDFLKERGVQLQVHFLKDKGELYHMELGDLKGVLKGKEKWDRQASFELPDITAFDLRFSIQIGEFPPPLISPKYFFEFD